MHQDNFMGQRTTSDQTQSQLHNENSFIQIHSVSCTSWTEAQDLIVLTTSRALVQE